jgi:hypothetical protein
MIGFELSATGSNGFRHKSGAWTEGSLVALKIVLSAPKVNPPGFGGTRRGMIGSIEASFAKIADALLNRVCSMGADFILFVTGDMKFKYVFDSAKSSDQVRSEFLHAIASTREEIGDQVMIHICRAIELFIMHNFDRMGEKLILNMEIDL